MKKTLWILGTLLGLYFIARAISWPFSVDAGDPSTYAGDWALWAGRCIRARSCGRHRAWPAHRSRAFWQQPTHE